MWHLIVSLNQNYHLHDKRIHRSKSQPFFSFLHVRSSFLFLFLFPSPATTIPTTPTTTTTTVAAAATTTATATTTTTLTSPICKDDFFSLFFFN